MVPSFALALLATPGTTGEPCECPVGAAVSCRKQQHVRRLEATSAAAATEQAIWQDVTDNLDSHGFMNNMLTLLKASDITYLRTMGSASIGDQRAPPHAKITHGTGGIAQAHFQFVDNPYSGLFQQADNCVVRIANAPKPDLSGPFPASYNPGIAIKCFRDGFESGNLLTTWELDGYNVLQRPGPSVALLS